MPFIYVEANDEFIIDFPEPDYMSSWDSASAEEICEKYEHPKCTIDFIIENPDDPIQPMLIFVADKEAYDGNFFSEKLSATCYRFKIHGKFRTNVHKKVVEAIKEGAKPKIDGVTRFREGHVFSEDDRQAFNKGKWVFSVKKI